MYRFSGAMRGTSIGGVAASGPGRPGTRLATFASDPPALSDRPGEWGRIGLGPRWCKPIQPRTSVYDARMADVVRRNLPNTLTILRLVLAAAFFGTLNAYRYTPPENALWANVAIAFFILAAITDALDGHLARRWSVQSTFGRIMDPFCDKVLILGAFIYLAGPRFVVAEWAAAGDFFTMATGVYPWMVVVIFARELLVTGIRGVIESMGVKFGSLWSGKAKMILQSITVPCILFLTVNFRPSEHAWAMWTCHVLVYTTLLVTVWSGMPYVFGMRRMMPSAGAGGGA
jgi:CDP-diacylglycerol---glycerol-3-phosphate 3-phosphatidyltransferase